MKYTIKKITHKPGNTICHKGIKKSEYVDFQKKHNVVDGGNGSYVTLSTGQTFVFLLTENGKYFPVDVYYFLKEITEGKKFTRKFIEELNVKLQDKEFELNTGESLNKKVQEILLEVI